MLPKLIFSSCYLDQIEGDAESENTKHMSSYNRPQYFTPSYSLKPQHITSLDGYYFIQYMNKIGWPQGGTFSTLLSTVGYDFHEENGLMVPKAEKHKVKDALVLLILELYVPSTIVITSSESAIKNTDYLSISWGDQTFKFQ